MKHCVKKLLSLAFALALCLAVGGIALAETPEQEVLAYEPNVTAEPGTNSIDKLATEGYQVTIPTTVTVKSGEDKGTLEVKAQLKQYRTLNIGIASNNKWKLAYDDTTAADTPKVDYTLTTADSENDKALAYYEDNTLHYGTGELDSTDPKYDSTTGARKFATNFSVNVKDPSQATMSGTYSDTLTFTFNLTKQSVTYTINVYHQEMALTNNSFNRADNAPKYQALKMVDKVGTNGAPIGDAQPDEVYTYEYGFANDKPVGSPPETWTRPRTGHSVSEDEDTRCWEDLTYALDLQQNYDTGNKDIVVNLNLVRKWCWLDVNGITNKDENGVPADGNQGGKIASFVNIKVSDGKNWSVWYWYTTGDDYWGTFPYGTEFQLYLHRVKDGYAYDADADGNVFIYANNVLTHTQTTDESGDGKTHYRVYQGKLEGEPVDKTLYNTRGGGISHAAGSYPRYCYNVCFVNGITYYDANGVKGGREDTNLYHGPHTTFQYTEGMTLADPITDCDFIAPDGKEFAGWSTTKDYTGQTLYAAGVDVSSVTWPARPTVSNNDTLPDKDNQTVCRTLYAIWKKPYTVKVQFGRDIGWTTWDAANQSFPESNQGGDSFDTAVALGTAYAYGNTSLTLSATENTEVWNALQTKITEKTKNLAGTTPPEDVWQLKDEYTFTTLPANSEVTISIKRKRYLLNVIPALQNDGGTFTPADDIATAKQYGQFDLDSCGKPQTLEGKISYYQWMRNYGGSYHIYNVKANTGYQFVGLMRMTSSGLTSTDDRGTLTGKNSDIHYFGDNSSREYTGDTIYVMYKKDMVTFDFNGGKNQEGETKTEEQYDPKSFIQKMSFQNNGTSYFIGWSLNKVEQPGETIYKPDSTRLGDIQWPDPENKVLYARWSTGPNRAPAKKKALTVHYHANFDPMEELALDLDPNPLLEDMDEDFGFDPDPLPEDILDPTVEAVKIVTYKPDENVVLRNCMFKRGGYVFVGWNTEPDGTGRNYEVNGVPITDWAAGTTVDLYAQWKKPEHLKPVVDGEPQPGGTTPAPTPQPGGADAAPAPQPGGVDDDFGIDPQLGGMDDAFGVDPQPGGMDDAFGIDPQSGGMDDAFGVDPQSGGMDDAFGV